MQEWKASEKEAQKMTRDGAISVNLVTGEATHISDRPPEQDYSSADDTAETSGRVVDEMEGLMWTKILCRVNLDNPLIIRRFSLFSRHNNII